MFLVKFYLDVAGVAYLVEGCLMIYNLSGQKRHAQKKGITDLPH